MAKKKVTKEYDENIIQALMKLDVPIIGKDGKQFYIRGHARNESGLEHIAKKVHRLKVRDIQSVPSILKHPQYACDDPDSVVYKNYYGIRKGNSQELFIKIVTSPLKHDKSKEEIVTIYPTKTIKVEKAKKKR